MHIRDLLSNKTNFSVFEINDIEIDCHHTETLKPHRDMACDHHYISTHNLIKYQIPYVYLPPHHYVTQQEG